MVLTHLGSARARSKKGRAELESVIRAYGEFA